MDIKEVKKVVTLSHYNAIIDCDICTTSTHHQITIQAVKEKKWFAIMTAVCFRCRNNLKIEFESKN
jgi:hypothetical protein